MPNEAPTKGSTAEKKAKVPGESLGIGSNLKASASKDGNVVNAFTISLCVSLCITPKPPTPPPPAPGCSSSSSTNGCSSSGGGAADITTEKDIVL